MIVFEDWIEKPFLGGNRKQESAINLAELYWQGLDTDLSFSWIQSWEFSLNIWLLFRAILMNSDYYRKDPLIRKWTYGRSRCYLWNNEIGNLWFWYLWFQKRNRCLWWWLWLVQFQGNQFEWWDQMLSACSDGILRSENVQTHILNLNLR